MTPVCLPALRSDPGTGGATSDHLIPTMRPIDMVNNKPARQTRKVKVRPLPDSVINAINHELEGHDWSNVYNSKTSNDKADTFKKEVMNIVNSIAPERIRNISSDDRPWYTEPLKVLDRKRRRKYNKNRRSKKYYRLQKEYNSRCSKAKTLFSQKNGNSSKRIRPLKMVFNA